MTFFDILEPRMGANADDDDDDEGLSLYRGKECLFDEYPGNDDDFSLKDKIGRAHV